MTPRGPKDDPRRTKQTLDSQTSWIASERIAVRADGRCVCWNCGATLAVPKTAGGTAWLLNGYRLRATSVMVGREDERPITVYRAGRQAKAAYQRDDKAAARGDVSARERLRAGRSTQHVQVRVLRAGPPDMDPEKIEQKRANIRREALTLPESDLLRSILLERANYGSDSEVAATIDSWNWVDPTKSSLDRVGRQALGEHHHALVECLCCGKYNESGVAL